MRAQLPAQRLDRTQRIAAEDLPYTNFGPASVQHFLDDARKSPKSRQILRWRDGPIEISADRGMVLSDGVHDVRQVIHHGANCDRAPPEERGLQHDTNGAAGIGHDSHLLVGDVSPVLVDARQSGVCHK